MNSLTISSPAKVNLFLKVLGRRRDGYHELLTRFHRISLQDQIILKKIKKPQFRLITTHLKLRSVRKNLIYKAYRLLKNSADWQGGVEVKLRKRIPIAAGLGGGSSNAAHFLLGMNRLFGLRLSRAALVKIGAQIGSDVPFFLYQTKEAIGTGRGERIKVIPCRHKLWFVLVVPQSGISTAQVYQQLKAAPLTRISADATITSAFSRGMRKKEKGHRLHNDLFPVSSRLLPQLRQIDALFDQVGAPERLMSGSGPTIFSIHPFKEEAEKVARRIQRLKLNAQVFVCHTY
ncbi:MAG: 4-(cytidine 5'-diphospho)-2-C-methyl-D-erythritol kinase [Candidatus Omnitrophica bacterium]|nr:4-(cytidine 5'-diphospho)-2-C-methyl-D-erythritol kinase [Candidatus Omnitrophota bacterium]